MISQKLQKSRWPLGLLGAAASLCLLGASNGISAASAGTPIHLASVTIESPVVGWGIDRHLGGQLVRTVNGGRSWTNVTPPEVTFNEATAATTEPSPPIPPHNTVTWYQSGSSAGTVTLLSRSTDGNGVVLVSKTTDGGVLWHQWKADLPHVAGASVDDPILDQADFVTADDGWLLMQPAYGIAAGMDHVGMELWQTTNGGHTWTEVDQIPSSTTIVAGPVTFTSATTGWMLEQQGDNNASLMRTTNAGRTWSPVSLGGAVPQRVPIFHGADGSIFVKTQQHPEVLESTDAGQHWSTPRSLPKSKAGLAVIEVSAMNPQVIWDSTGNTLWRSETGGRTWVVESRATLLTHNTAMDGLNRSIAWTWDATVGDSSTMASTTNGGQTWTTWTPVLIL